MRLHMRRIRKAEVAAKSAAKEGGDAASTLPQLAAGHVVHQQKM